MTNANYLPRVADDQLQRLLETVGAVLIQGPKWCGKTTTAEQKASSVLYFDDPRNLESNISKIQNDPDLILDGEMPRLIDEWQLAPTLWDAIRFKVDHRPGPGQFILTGSAVPADKSKIKHSGVGRFAKLTMRPMSLWESQDSSGEVSLKNLFNHQPIKGTSTLNVRSLAYLICRGGWPSSLQLQKDKAIRVAKEYLKLICDEEISEVDGVRRDAKTTRLLLRSYARNQATQATTDTLFEDIAKNRTIPSSDRTLYYYLKALRELFVIDDVPAWNPNLRSKTAIRASDTRYLIDPSLSAAALGMGPDDLIEDFKTFGLFFEALCIRDLHIFAEALDGNLYHYRDRNGLECDAVIHLNNGQYGLIEIKIGGESLIKEGLANLKKLSSDIDTQQMSAPAFKMLLVGTETQAYYDKQWDTYIVPIGCLKP